MRAIKFRGWNGEKMLPPEDITVSPDYRTWLGKIDCELMQFTGLMDKSGKEIYEGDLLRFKDFPKGYEKVFYEDGAFQMETVREDDELRSWLTQNLMEDFEVVGNIYENTELI